MTNFNLNRPGSTNKFSKYNNTFNFRLVSQEEIYEFIKENPEMSEPEIIYYVYGYKRHNTYYEKRYAEGFRRALRKYNIQRKPGVNKLTGKKAYVYFTKEFMNKTINNFKEKHCNVKNDDVVVEKQTPKSLLKNFDIVKTNEGRYYFANIDSSILIGINHTGWLGLTDYDNELISEYAYTFNIDVIYRCENGCYFQYFRNFNGRINHWNIIWEKYEPKTYNYTMDEIKELLGADKRDNLIIK